MKSFVDEGPTIRIYYDLEGQRRKDLVKALGEILLWEPKYLGAPTFSYEVGNYIVTKIGDVEVGRAGSISTLVGEYKAGDTIAVTLIRDGKTMTVNVTLAAYEE